MGAVLVGPDVAGLVGWRDSPVPSLVLIVYADGAHRHAGGIVPFIDGRTAPEQRHGLGGPAVVLQETKERFERMGEAADLIPVLPVREAAAISYADQVVASGGAGKGTEAVRASGTVVAGQQNVGQHDPAHYVEHRNPAALLGRVVTDGGASHGQRTWRVGVLGDAPANGGVRSVVADGTVRHAQRATIRDASAVT